MRWMLLYDSDVCRAPESARPVLRPRKCCLFMPSGAFLGLVGSGPCKKRVEMSERVEDTRSALRIPKLVEDA